jgi:tRNA (guanine-N7-)-methyltransferase
VISNNIEKLYGRVKSRALTNRQAELYKSLLPGVSIASFDSSFLSRYVGVSFEIGFGSGEHLFQLAISSPNKLFIGCEFFINGITSLLSKIDEEKIENIKIFQGDARKLIPEIPNSTIENVFLLFPDPWPKRKHIYRRFVQERTILGIYKMLRDDGFLKIATDCPTYAQWVNTVLATPSCDKKFAIETFDLSSRPDESVWPKTRYERKSIENCTFFSLKKLRSL